jgi:hypothetical protein
VTDQLPVPASGGTVVPSNTGGAVAPSGGNVVPLGEASRGTTSADKVNVASAAREAVWMDWVRTASITTRQREKTERWLEQRAPDFAARHEERRIEERLAADERDKAAALSTMRSEWGTSYDHNIDRIHTWLDAQPEDFSEELLNARHFDGTPICSKPSFLRALLQCAGARSSRGVSASGQGAELREIEALMSDRNSRYFRGPDAASLQARYRELLDQGVSGSQSARQSSNVETEIREIEAMMKDRRSRYYKGPDAEGLQQRYRALVDMRGGRR